MRILVYPHDLGMGGSQLNAIELAAAVRDLGHEVAVYGHPGVLCEHIDRLGLRFIPSPPPRRRPGSAIVADLRRRIREDGWDLVHGYEWPPILEARLACAGTRARPVGTIMSMAVPGFIPRDLPLVVGTRQIAAYERARGRRAVSVIEPPVDTVANAPENGGDIAGFRAAHDIPDGRHLVVVSRLADELKGEGLLTAIAEAPRLGSDVVLTVVGDGPARDRVEAAAAGANQAAGRRAVVLTDEVTDPRPAYAMADIALGMGGSALRAMAFAKPLVVQGEKGFWERLTPESIDQFLWSGWYGVGDDPASGPGRFRAAVEPLIADPGLRTALGDFARESVEARFSLTGAARVQEHLYERLSSGRGARIPVQGSDIAGAARFVGYKTQRWRQRLFATKQTRDDFNAAPVAAAPAKGGPPLLVYAAGVDWGAVPGTDHRLVTELLGHFPVVWVDPAEPLTSRIRGPRGSVPAGLTRLGDRLWRLHVVTVPGVTRPVLRQLARRHHAVAVRRLLQGSGASGVAVVVADPMTRLDLSGFAGSVLLVTDDFVAGAPLMGLDVADVRRRLAANVASADVVLAVSPTLAGRLGPPGTVGVFPNGCVIQPEASRPPDIPEPPVAGVVGQLNERIDAGLLLGVAEAGAQVLVVGPRCERDPECTAELDAVLAHPRVTWTGRVPSADLPGYLAAIDVGLTPYRDSEFNRASFPLKTLEYLGAGRRVVSTDLPASRWLDTPMVDVAESAEQFVELTLRRLAEGRTGQTEDACRDVAARHTWAARADELASIVHRLVTGRVPATKRIPEGARP